MSDQIRNLIRLTPDQFYARYNPDNFYLDIKRIDHILEEHGCESNQSNKVCFSPFMSQHASIQMLFSYIQNLLAVRQFDMENTYFFQSRENTIDKTRFTILFPISSLPQTLQNSLSVINVKGQKLYFTHILLSLHHDIHSDKDNIVTMYSVNHSKVHKYLELATN